MTESMNSLTDSTGQGREGGSSDVRAEGPSDDRGVTGAPRQIAQATLGEAADSDASVDSIVIPAPQPGDRLVVAVQPGRDLQFAFDPATAQAAEVDGDIVLTLPDGGVIVLEGFAEAAFSGNPPELTNADGAVINIADFLVALGVSPEDVEAAAGQPAGPLPGTPNQGASFAPGPAPEILDSLDPTGPLGPTELQYGVPEPEFDEFRAAEDEDEDDGGEEPSDGAPAAADDAASVQEGDTLAAPALNVLSNDDQGSDGATVTALAGGTLGVPLETDKGFLTLNADGSYSYQAKPGLDHSGGPLTDSFTYTITDGDGDASTATLTITITDSGPTAANDGVTVQEGGSLVAPALNVLGNDAAGSDGGLTVTGLSGGTIGIPLETDKGFLTLNADGSYGYQAKTGLDHSGGDLTDSFTYTVTDADGSTSTATLTITITDTGPAAASDAGTVAEDATLTVLTVNGVLTNDNGGQDGGLVVTGLAGGTVGSRLETDKGFLTLNADGSYTYEAKAGLDHSGGDLTDSFSYTITDADGSTSTATLVITITDRGPVAANDAEVVQEGTTLAVAAADGVLSNDNTGPDGGLTVTGLAGGAIGVPIETDKGFLTLNADGSYSYEAKPGLDHSNGELTDSFTYTIADADGTTSTATLTIMISDGGPAADADIASVVEGQSVGGSVIDSGDEFGSDGPGSAPVANPGTYVGAHGTLVLNPDGTYTYTANGNLDHSSGDLTDSFTYTVVDGDGSTASNTLTITITDGVPTASADSATLNEAGGDDGDASTAFEAVSVSGNLTGNDTFGGDGVAAAQVADASYDNSLGEATKTVTTTGITFIGTGWSLVIDRTTGDYTFTQTAPLDHPAGDGPLTPKFTYTIEDGDGSTASADLTITIADDVPTAENDLDLPVEGETVTGNVLSNDDQGADGAIVTAVEIGGVVHAVSGETTITGANGTLVINPDGSYSYTANDGLIGVQGDEFTYTITDADGDTATATLYVEIEDANEPTANDDSTTLNEADGDDGDASTPFSPVSVDGNLLTNDSAGGDGFGSPVKITQLVHDGALGAATTVLDPVANTITLNGAGWTLVVEQETGDYVFTQTAPLDHPAGDGALAGQFSYTIQDADGSEATANLNITITDDVPQASNDAEAIGEGETVTGNILDNDDFGADGASLASVNGQPVSDGTTIAGAHGTLTINADGSYSYKANASVSGEQTDSFDYTITDGDGDTSTATLEISINDSVPVAKNDTVHVFSGQQKEFKLVYVMDVSGSMNELLPDGSTRLDAAKEAFARLNQQAIAAGLGGAEVLIITFSSGVQQVQEFSRADDPDIESFINGLTATGGTTYEPALDVAADWLDGRAIDGGINGAETTTQAMRHGQGTDSRIFFLSDGGNNSDANGFDSEYRDVDDLYSNVGDLANNLTNVTIKTVGFGISDTSSGHYHDVDQADDNLQNGSAVAVPDLAGVEGIEAGFGDIGSQNVVFGNVLDNDVSDDGVKVVLSITIDGVEHLASGGNLVDVETTFGGRFSFDFTTGGFSYKPPADPFANGTETFSYVMRDDDGDQSTASLTIEIDPGLLPNGGFELGNLLDWDVAGAAWVSDQADLVQEGDFVGVLHTNHANPGNINNLTPAGDGTSYSDDALDDFLGLASGTIDGLIAEYARQGSAMKTSITVDPGMSGTISFDWNFLTTEDGASHNDFAFVVIEGEVHMLANSDNSGSVEGNVVNIDDLLVDGQGFTHGTGWQNNSFSFTDTNNDGKIDVAFGVVDGRSVASDNVGNNSALMVDDVQATITASS